MMTLTHRFFPLPNAAKEVFTSMKNSYIGVESIVYRVSDMLVTLPKPCKCAPSTLKYRYGKELTCKIYQNGE